MKMQERGLWNSRNITVNVTLVTPVYKEASLRWRILGLWTGSVIHGKDSIQRNWTPSPEKIRQAPQQLLTTCVR